MRRLQYSISFAIGSMVMAVVLLGGPKVYAQLQQSGGPGSSVSIVSALPAGSNLIGKTGIDQTTPGTTNKVSIGTDGTVALNAAIPTGANVIGNVGINGSLPALSAGTNIIGFVRVLPAGCTQTSRFSSDTVGVATSTGTTVTSTTTCLLQAYVNNITNSAVTFRVADKTGTPVIWLGGNADFTIPANSNIGLPMLSGIVMSNGITAIAGTASALNLHVEGYQ